MKAEGRSYKGGRLGAENVMDKKCDKAQSRVELTRRRRGGVKRIIKERRASPISTQSSSDSSGSSDETDTLYSIYHQREPEPIAKRRIGKKNQS